MKTIALIIAIFLPLILLILLARRKSATSWQHHALLTVLTIYSSILLLGVSDHLASFGYGEAKVEFVNSKVEEAKKILEKVERLQAEIDFSSIKIEALNDSRPAFDELRRNAADPKNAFSQQAKDEVDTIILNYSQSTFMDGKNKYPWPTGTDLQKITFNQAEAEYAKASKVNLPYLIQFIWENPNFSKPQKMKLMMRIVQTGKSLTAVVWAGYYVKEEANLLHLPALSHAEYEAWWEKNKDKYKE